MFLIEKFSLLSTYCNRSLSSVHGNQSWLPCLQVLIAWVVVCATVQNDLSLHVLTKLENSSGFVFNIITCFMSNIRRSAV